MCRALPDTTIRERRGCGTNSCSVSLVKLKKVSDSRLMVIRRLPHNQLSSRCGSMAEPRSGTYSKLHSSTGKKSANPGTNFCTLSTNA